MKKQGLNQQGELQRQLNTSFPLLFHLEMCQWRVEMFNIDKVSFTTTMQVSSLLQVHYFEM